MQRSVTLMVFAALVAGLVASGFYLRGQMSELDRSRSQLQALEREIAGLSARQSQVEQDRRVKEYAAALVDRAEQLDLDSGRWTERRLRYRSSSIARAEAVAILAETMPVNASTIFIPQSWTIGVADPGFSLFRTPSARERGLDFELVGTLYLHDEANP